MTKVRFYGQSDPINTEACSWDYTRIFETDEEVAEAIEEYVTYYDDPEYSIARYEVL